MKATRAEVYAAIDGERTYQKRMWGDDDSGTATPETLGGFLTLLRVYSAKADFEFTGEPAPEVKTLHVVRKIAALAVACLEAHGAPPRE